GGGELGGGEAVSAVIGESGPAAVGVDQAGQVAGGVADGDSAVARQGDGVQQVAAVVVEGGRAAVGLHHRGQPPRAVGEGGRQVVRVHLAGQLPRAVEVDLRLVLGR